MLKTLTCLCRWRLLLLTAGLYSVLWAHPLQAAILKDIRLGEYDTYTRIVFEFDKAPPSLPEISGDPNELRFIFSDITLDLVRKIPIKQSRHVQAVQIWLKDRQLSTLFKVDAPFTHDKILSINNPPRVLVDIHWQAAAQGTKTSETIVQNNTSPVETVAPAIPPDETSAPVVSNSQPAAPPANEAPVGALKSSDLPAKPSMGSDSQPPEATVLTPPGTPLPAGNENPGVAPPALNPRPHPIRFQFYLVIGLVVLTIVILVLLVLMLLTKYKWVNHHLRLNIDDHLKEQKAQIETINGRIKEQLKHYKKA